jgi:imidazolonepropionase-like amidohydrolase
MLAIRARRVFDGQRVPADAGAVLVDGGRIVGITPAGEPVAEGWEVAEFPGATLLPGLIDTHVHLCGDGGPNALERLGEIGDDELTAVIESALRQHLSAGVTTVRDLGDRRWAVIDWRDRHRASGAGLPTVLGSGPPITSVRGHCWNMGGEVAGVAQLRAAVRERAERGVDVVKIMASGGAMTPGTDVTVPQFTTEELRAVVEQAHAAGLRVTAHAHAVTAIRSAIAAGVDGIEHCSFVTNDGVQIAADVLAAVVESSITVCPTLGVAPGVSPPPALLEILEKLGVTDERRRDWIRRLHEAGVRFVSGSDAGINPSKPHGLLPRAVIELAEAGAASTFALASATSLAAQACGVGDRKGRVAAGFEADLLLVDGDPEADITALLNVVAVYRAGQRVR